MESVAESRTDSARRGRKRDTFDEGLRSFRRFATTLLIIALVGLLAVIAFKQLIHEQVRRLATKQLNDHYHQSGLHIDIGSARFVNAKGFHFYGVRIRDLHAEGHPEIVAVDRLSLESDTNFISLLRGDIQFNNALIDGFRVVAVESKTGTWNLERLMPPPPSKTGSAKPIPITIKNGSAKIRYGNHRDDQSIALNDITAEFDFSSSKDETSVITQTAFNTKDYQSGAEVLEDYQTSESSPELMFLRLGFSSERIKRITLSGCFDLQQGLWGLKFSGDKVLFDEALLDLIPESICHPAEKLQAIQGNIDFEGWAAGAFNATQPIEFEVNGTVHSGRFIDAQIPYPLDDLQAKFKVSSAGFELSDLTARFGSSQLAIESSGAFECLFGHVTDTPMDLVVRGTNLRFEPALRAALPPDLQQIWDDFSPEGLFDVVVELEQTRSGWKPTARIELVNVAITPKAFPYKITGCNGLITWIDKIGTIDFDGFAGNCRTSIEGTIDDDKSQPSEINITTFSSIPIDARLLEALQNNPNLQNTIYSLAPQGNISCDVHLRRVGPEQKIGLDELNVQLHDCRMRYARFPYPVTDINGSIVFKDELTRFVNLTGKNDGGLIFCEGNVDLFGNITLNLTGHSISLEQELKDALPVALRQLWDNLQPRGSIDQVKLDVVFDSQKKSTSYTVHADEYRNEKSFGQTLSIQPVWFPYRLQNLIGSFNFDNNIISITGLEAEAGNARVSTQGRGIVTEDGWHTVFENLSVDSLIVDDSFIAALPPALGATLRELRPRGPINMIGKLTLHSYGGGLPAEPTFFSSPEQVNRDTESFERELRVDWDMRMDMENGSLYVGRDIEHIHGGLRLIGQQDSKGVQQIGEIDVDSMVVENTQFTNVRGPIRITSDEVSLGRWSTVPDQMGILRPVTGDVLNGHSNLNLKVHLSKPERPFVAQIWLEDASLGEAANHFANRVTDLEGTAFAWVEMHGDARGRSSFQGEGEIHLQDARIYQVPVLLSMLKVLSVKQPDNTAFTSGDIKFQFIDEHVYFNNIVLAGDAISLRGLGEMDFDGNLDLEFYTIVGREDRRIPLISNAFGAASQNILRIDVSGSIQDPIIGKTAFPGLNEKLQQLFPDVTEDDPMPIIPEIPSIGQSLGRR